MRPYISVAALADSPPPLFPGVDPGKVSRGSCFISQCYLLHYMLLVKLYEKLNSAKIPYMFYFSHGDSWPFGPYLFFYFLQSSYRLTFFVCLFTWFKYRNQNFRSLPDSLELCNSCTSGGNAIIENNFSVKLILNFFCLIHIIRSTCFKIKRPSCSLSSNAAISSSNNF